MAKKSPDLHGNAPDNARVVLLLIDVINDLEFEGGDRLLRQAMPAARQIAELKGRARLAGIPSIYVNDNFGKWRSDFKKLIAHCLDDKITIYSYPVIALSRKTRPRIGACSSSWREYSRPTFRPSTRLDLKKLVHSGCQENSFNQRSFRRQAR